MSLFANIEETKDINDQGDVLGGGGTRESGIYPFTVKMAYVQPAKSGAIGVHLTLEDDKGQELRRTEYITSGTAKGGKNYYERNGQKNYLPGFLLINDLALLITGHGLTDLEAEIEEKLVPIYNFESQKEIPTKVPVLIPLLNKPIKAGVLKVIEDKRTKGDDGEYVPTGETREVNEINKFFHAESGMTVTELKANADEAVFIQQWDEKRSGQTIDKTTKVSGKSGAPSARPGLAGAASGGAATPSRPSLFPGKS